jgi:hypothetical protein
LEVKRVAAPKIGLERLLQGDELCAHRVEVNVVAGRFEIASAAAFDRQGFVTSGKKVTKEPLLMIEA